MRLAVLMIIGVILTGCGVTKGGPYYRTEAYGGEINVELGLGQPNIHIIGADHFLMFRAPGDIDNESASVPAPRGFFDGVDTSGQSSVTRGELQNNDEVQ